MSIVVTGRFDGLIQAEEALTESLLRFSHEDVALVPPVLSDPERARCGSLVMIRTAHASDRRLAVRTLQGRGAFEVSVRLDTTAAHRKRDGHTAAAA